MQSDIKERKLSVLQRKIENLEELLKEKDNQLELSRSKLNAVQAQTFTSEGTLTSLEEALNDRDKQVRPKFKFEFVIVFREFMWDFFNR